MSSRSRVQARKQLFRITELVQAALANENCMSRINIFLIFNPYEIGTLCHGRRGVPLSVPAKPGGGVGQPMPGLCLQAGKKKYLHLAARNDSNTLRYKI